MRQNRKNDFIVKFTVAQGRTLLFSVCGGFIFSVYSISGN